MGGWIFFNLFRAEFAQAYTARAPDVTTTGEPADRLKVAHFGPRGPTLAALPVPPRTAVDTHGSAADACRAARAQAIAGDSAFNQGDGPCQHSLRS
jgi:hypothetical protein